MSPKPFSTSPASPSPTRRALLRGLFGAAAALAASSVARESLGCGPSCRATGEDIEGPYFLPGAPLRTSLVEAGMEGLPLELSGRVRTDACEPLGAARLEFWQADARGTYDVRGMRLRAALETDANGAFALRTIVPGRYRNGAQFRPAHIHMKVHARGRVLTTQLYFAGDPHNAADPWFRAERAMQLVTAGPGYRATFDPTVAG